MQNKLAAGTKIEVTLGATVAAGDVVQVGKILGVAVNGGDSGDVIAVDLTGAYRLSKASVAITKGDPVYWDIADKEANDDIENPIIGIAMESQVISDTTVDVLLRQDVLLQAAMANITDLSIVAVSDVVGNTIGDINGAKDAIMVEVDATKNKVNAVLAALQGAGLMA